MNDPVVAQMVSMFDLPAELLKDILHQLSHSDLLRLN
jgi:hypothetical protein